MKILTIVSAIFISSSLLATSLSFADELIQYSDRGNILGRLQCDKIAVHDSPQQSTLICTKTPKIDLNIQLVPLRSDSDYRNCRKNSNCVVIDNENDPAWRPIALYGIPEATFGLNIRGTSCVRIRETRPRFTDWSKGVWNLCSNDSRVELAYTYADGYKNDGIQSRFKQRDAKKVCFDEVLRGYQYRQFWSDNCIYVRQK